MTDTAQAIPMLIRRKELARVTGLSPSTVNRLEDEGKFPKRRRVGSCVGWLSSEVLAFLNAAPTD